MLKISGNSLSAGSERMMAEANSMLLAASLPSGLGMGAGISSIMGVSEAGTIHARLLHTDPASAQQTLGKFAQHIGWMGKTFSALNTFASVQDMTSQLGLESADIGYRPLLESHAFEDEPATDYQPLSYLPPVVMLGGSLDGAVSEILGINTGVIAEATLQWTSLAETAAELVGELTSVAAAISGENEGAAIEAGVSKIGNAIASAQAFAANASVMAAKTGLLEAGALSSQATAVALAAAAKAIPEPTARVAMEQAALQTLRTSLQTAVDASLPGQGSMMEPGTANGGGSVETGLAGNAGIGKSYSTSGVAWPEAMLEAARRGALGPGSFGVVDGQLQPLQGLGLAPHEADAVRQAAQAHLGQVAQHAGLPMNLGDLGTDAASTLAPGAGVGAVPGGVGALPSVGGGAGAGGVLPAGVGGVGSVGAAGSPGVAGLGMGAVPMTGRGRGAVAGDGGNAPNLGRLPQSGVLGGRLGGAGMSGAGGGALGAGSLGQAGAGAMRGAGGIGGIGGGVPGAGSAGGAGGAGAGATGGAAGGTGGATANGANKGGMRMMPGMMGGAGAGNGNGRGTIKTVTTKIEAEPNRRALLHPLPPAVPGVIGAWVRD